MSEEEEAHFAKAERMLRAARVLLGDGEAEGSINRAYYACFHAAQAALLRSGERPKTHAGTHNRFAFHYIRAGSIPVDVGRILPDAAQLRERTDYDAFAVGDLSAAADLVRDAERFVDAVREALT